MVLFGELQKKITKRNVVEKAAMLIDKGVNILD